MSRVINQVVKKWFSFLCNNPQNDIGDEKESVHIQRVQRFSSSGVSFFDCHSYRERNKTVSFLENEHQIPLMSQTCHQCLEINQLPPIYSGIGLGVYQGEVVVFLQMAIGEKRWTVSKLRFEDLSQLPSSTLSEVCLLLCLLRLNNKQSDLVKTGLQTKGGIELMKSYCSQAGNLEKLLSEKLVYNNPVSESKLNNQQAQSQSALICQQCPYMTQSNIEEGGGQL